MLRIAIFVWALVLCAQSKWTRQHTETGVMDYDDEATADIPRRLAGSTGMTAADRTALLDKHNALRSITALGNTPGEPSASDMLELSWDPALEAVATAYARKCVWEHNPSRASEYNAQPSKKMTVSWVGENLYMTSRNTGALSLLISGIQGWYDEYVDYTYSSTGGSCASNAMCGHYTQVVWAKTMYLGCGYAICGPVAKSSFQTATLLVCNYLPGGNYRGQPIYPQGSPCSTCSSTTSCSAGLCVTAGGGGSNPGPSPVANATPRPTSPTARPTPPTPIPTMKPVTQTGFRTKGDGSCNAGLTGTMGFYFMNSGATCRDYQEALIRYQPCVGQIVSCLDEPYPGYASYRRVTIKWQLNSATWSLGFTAWRNGIQKQCEAMGFVFSGALAPSTPPADSGTLTSSTEQSAKKNDPLPMILGIVFGVLAVLAIAGGCFWYARRQKQSSDEYRIMQEQRQGQYHPPADPLVT